MNNKQLLEELRQLYVENDLLRQTVERLQEQLDGMQLSLSLEETIEAMRETAKAEQAKPAFNPFRTLFNNTDTEGDGKSDAMMTPEQPVGRTDDGGR